MKRGIIGFAILWTLFVLVVARSDWAYKPIPTLSWCDFGGAMISRRSCAGTVRGSGWR